MQDRVDLERRVDHELKTWYMMCASFKMDSSFLKSISEIADSIPESSACRRCRAVNTFSRLDCSTPSIIEEDVPANRLVDRNPGPTKELNCLLYTSDAAD